MSIAITWLGHACFKVETQGYAIVIDPYTGVEGYSEFETTANAVLCSHGHDDHSYRAAVTLQDYDAPSPFRVISIPCFHDDRWGELRGENTIHLLDCGGLRVAHFGDLGHMPSPSDIDVLRGCDAVMIPVGGYYTIDAKMARELADALAPKVFLPMHYRRGALGFPELAPLDDYLALCGDVREHPGNTIQITAETPAQTAVLQYIRPE